MNFNKMLVSLLIGDLAAAAFLRATVPYAASAPWWMAAHLIFGMTLVAWGLISIYEIMKEKFP